MEEENTRVLFELLAGLRKYLAFVAGENTSLCYEQ
jgi:hypothetical protein